MRLVYTHPALIVVSQARSELEMQGIKCMLRNEYAAGAIGELSPIDAWPELWVLENRDWQRATRALEKMQTETGEADWQCARCGNSNPATFETCWHCAGERPPSIVKEGWT
ncbi:MAG: DUF2007 domain-containing protein [Halieaceae bacterium]|nr:DUF2007 domain-containing protein [Halieaceae bacterium]